MAINYQEIGANIKIERVKKGMKQYELAELVHISPQHMSHIECGSAKMGLSPLVDIANVLGTSVDALLGTSQDTNRRKILEAQFASIMEPATDEIQELCFALCKYIVEWHALRQGKE